MDAERAICQMLRMYNRRDDDHTVGNYLQISANYSDEEVIRAIKKLVAENVTLPLPRALLALLARNRRATSPSDPCDECKGSGVKRWECKTHNGIEFFERGWYERCHCNSPVTGHHAKMKTREEAKRVAFVYILAKMVGDRACDETVIQTMEDWGRYCWDKSVYDEYLQIVQSVSMLDLVSATKVVRDLDKGLCQSDPVKAARELLGKTKKLPTPKLFNSVGGV